MENLHRLFMLDRLFKSHRHPISLQVLLDKLECSVSTFKRLIKTLREQYHYPIVYSKQQQGYYYAKNQAVPISGLWFTASELQALLIMRHVLKRLQPSLLSDYFDELAHQVNQLLIATGKAVNDLEKQVHIVPIAHQYIAADFFIPLCQATLHRRVVRIHYQDIEGRPSDRLLSPQRIVYYKNNWYLDAWCHLRQALRTFWMAGIQSVNLTKDIWYQVDSSLLTAHLESSYGIFAGVPTEMAHLRFTGRAARRVQGSEWHPKQRQQLNRDQSLELWVPYSDSRELIMDILRYGHEVKVLAPTSLKQALLKQLKKNLAIYE